MAAALKFRTAADAHAEADRMEELRDDDVRAHRDAGREGTADRTADKWNRQIEQVRAEGRRLAAKEARETPQPADVPTEPPARPKAKPAAKAKKTPRRAPARRRGPARSRGGGSSRRGGFAPRLRTGYRRSGAQSQVTSWSGFGWQLAGLTIGVALLTLFLTPRGAGAFSDLTGGAAGLLKLIVDPIDPLAPKAVAATLTAPPRSPAAPSRSVPASQRASSRGPLAVV